ncbi:hypothetical protein SLE2022_190330 [Rubroshorea leprosula]|uniref:Uncharacterized protein n=1 Tax=Rubroshorea leprosula TaxID=152421 RepID=A0AAV5JQK9_9ROSI|nr:hypothetical protein SLEP1_g27521 [Rubroshorea leprosula]
MENITASELAGFGVAVLLLGATITAPKVDAFISASQRSALGMCKRCGDLKVTACPKCKGTGLIRTQDPFSFNLMEDINQYFGSPQSKANSTPCTKCQARGHFSCPDCSKISKV